MYAVSVGSVREAISMLISAGLVETRAGRGTYVVNGGRACPAVEDRQPLGRQEVEELVEAREVIELELAELAAQRACRSRWRQELAVERMEAAAASPDGYPDADVDFHLALAEAAGNRYLLGEERHPRAAQRGHGAGGRGGIRRFGDLRISVEDHRPGRGRRQPRSRARANDARRHRPPQSRFRARPLRHGARSEPEAVPG